MIDANISPKVAEPLRAAGHDVTVAREVGLSRASDDVVMATARAEQRVLVSADTDFGAILARTRATSPSFILVRRAASERPAEQAALVLNNLEAVAKTSTPARLSSSATGLCGSDHFPSDSASGTGIILKSDRWSAARTTAAVPNSAGPPRPPTPRSATPP